jgi:NAD(P)-dependent dehydrogenase (short-subunit alcohol dehydrogenase family)
VRLDVTSPGDVEAAARQADDATIVVNNAGIASGLSAAPAVHLAAR